MYIVSDKLRTNDQNIGSHVKNANLETNDYLSVINLCERSDNRLPVFARLASSSADPDQLIVGVV